MSDDRDLAAPRTSDLVMTALEEARAVGAMRMRAQIAKWHSDQGYQFADLVAQLERDRAKPEDIMKMRWAASSHHAHAAAIYRMALPARRLEPCEGPSEVNVNTYAFTSKSRS